MSDTWTCPRCGPDARARAGDAAYRDRRCTRCDGPLVPASAVETISFECPSCRAMVPSESAGCERCGARFGGGGVGRERCPGCGVDLVPREAGEASISACAICHGIFVTLDVLDTWTADHASRAPSELAQEAVFEEETWRVRYRRCPRCTVMMHRVNFAPNTGVILDVCAQHGYWLDAGEFERILNYVREHGTERTVLHRFNARERERQKRLEAAAHVASFERLEDVPKTPRELRRFLGDSLIDLLRSVLRG